MCNPISLCTVVGTIIARDSGHKIIFIHCESLRFKRKLFIHSEVDECNEPCHVLAYTFLVHRNFNLKQTLYSILKENIFNLTKYLVWIHSKLINISLVFIFLSCKIIRIEYREFRKENKCYWAPVLFHQMVLFSEVHSDSNMEGTVCTNSL